MAEEPHQAFEVLRSCGHEELLPHKLQSPQAQATQPDLIFQFSEQCFHLLSLPLGMRELWRLRQLPGTLSRGFIHVDRKIAKLTAGALRF